MYFEKTLDEIDKLVILFNESFIEDTGDDFFEGLSFEFSGWWAAFKFQGEILFSTENNPQEYNELTDEYENIKLTLIRELNKKFDQIVKITFQKIL